MSSTRLSFLLSAVSSAWDSSASLGRRGGRGWATGFVIFFVFLWQLMPRLSFLPRRHHSAKSVSTATTSTTRPPEVSTAISNADLVNLIGELQGESVMKELWEDVVVKRNDSVSYIAKCCRQKDGSLKYLSITTFERCSTELLRDFYMDNDYRKKWDRTVVDHEQLELDEVSNLEFGRTLKKFPLLTTREYILVWRLWEGKDKCYYCLTKDCEHPRTTRQKKYVRIGFFRSGWCIKKVPGRDACEIRIVHQEDAGLNIEMAKLAFAKGIWNYIRKMDAALRGYSSWKLMNSSPKSMLKLVPVPHEIEAGASEKANILPGLSSNNALKEERLARIPSKGWIGKGLLLLGGVVCLSRGHSTLATQLAVARILKSFAKERHESIEDTEKSPEALLGRWSPRQNTKFQRSFSRTDWLSPQLHLKR